MFVLQDDSVVHHMAAKAIENIATVSGSTHPLVTMEMGSTLWYLYTHSTAEAVRVAAVSVCLNTLGKHPCRCHQTAAFDTSMHTFISLDPIT